MTPFPTDSKWAISQASDIFGHIIRTRNLDFKRRGYAGLAKKAMCLLSHGDSDDARAGYFAAFQGTVLAILSDDRYFYIITPIGTLVVDSHSNLQSALETIGSNQPSYGFDSDAVMFKGKPHVSGGQYVSDLNSGIGGTYAARRISGLDTDMPHPLCVFENRITLLVGDGNVVRQYDTSYSEDTDNKLTLPSEYIVTTIRWRGNKAYIGTRHSSGGKARMFVWNGSGSSAQEGWAPGGDWIYSLCEFDASMCAITSRGQIRRYNGGGFDDLANFPVYQSGYNWSSQNPEDSLVGRVANRGSATDGDVLYVVIDGRLNHSALTLPGEYLVDQPSGLWVFDKRSGLYHKAAPNFAPRLCLEPVGVASSYLTFDEPHQAQTGDAVHAIVDDITGIVNGQTYYVIVDETANEFTCRLALSPAEAFEGFHIMLGETVGTDAFLFDRYETLGQSMFDGYAGAVHAFEQAASPLFFASEVLWGMGALESPALYSASLMSLGMGRNRGRLVTPWIRSTGAKDFLKKFYAYMKRLNLDSDTFVVRYRIREKFGMPTHLAYSGTATWTGPNTFTVDTLTHEFKVAAVKDAIEIVTGAASGYLVHITAIDRATSTYAVTVDEALPVENGDTFDFVADNWTFLNQPATNSGKTNEDGFTEQALGKTSGRVQFLLELKGFGVMLEMLELVSSTQKRP